MTIMGHGSFNSETPKTRILVVGELDKWRSQGRDVPVIEAMRFADFDDVTADLLDDFAPEIILSPMYASAFDAMDLAQRLHALDYRGRYRVTAPQLPDPDVICEEVAQLAPALDFDLLMFSMPPVLQA